MKVASQLLASLTANVWLIVGSLVLGALAAITGLLRPKSRIPYACARWWGGSLVGAAGVRIRTEREAELDPSKRFVFFANHQSLYDIPVLLHTLPVDARFLAKKSLFMLPIFGFAMRKAGFVPVDRGAGVGSAKAALRAATEQLDLGRSILVFPEETRSKTGEVLPFKIGGLLIALRAGAAIVPVGVDGTRLVRPKGSLLVSPGRVTVRFGRPLDATSFGVRGKRQALAHLRSEVARLARAPLATSPDSEAESKGNLSTVSSVEN